MIADLSLLALARYAPSWLHWIFQTSSVWTCKIVVVIRGKSDFLHQLAGVDDEVCILDVASGVEGAGLVFRIQGRDVKSGRDEEISRMLEPVPGDILLGGATPILSDCVRGGIFEG